jgi:hypothetical protein
MPNLFLQLAAKELTTGTESSYWQRQDGFSDKSDNAFCCMGTVNLTVFQS